MKEESSNNNPATRLTTVLFIIYGLALVWILLLKLGVQFSYMGTRSTNFIPFNEPVIFTGENFLNVLIFVPLGIYVGVLFTRWIFGKKLFFLFLLSLLVEGLQYLFRIGAFDVTDLMTNTLGGLIGLLVFSGLERAFRNGIKAQKFINFLAVPATALLILLLVLLKMNLLPVRYQ
ncbi:VanZ family protein [Cyclobacterium roseum]|uniref:VanZ family protein n=1 Tax=Cyclobacterium roseum TaxID=2666137 RepID=UPI001391126E|nr:VanZ family protein [Cyclobacterium roseum]